MKLTEHSHAQLLMNHFLFGHSISFVPFVQTSTSYTRYLIMYLANCHEITTKQIKAMKHFDLTATFYPQKN